MAHPKKENNDSAEIVVTAQEFFKDVVQEALEKRGVEASYSASNYLVSVLQFYVHAENLFPENKKGEKKQNTLAEMYLRAVNAEKELQKELLKTLGDSSLYISGFFGDSLKRKIIDIDYYAEMGERAYATLATVSQEDFESEVFDEFAKRFMDFVDVLTYISQKSMVQSNVDLLRLYDRYLNTGSELAKEQLMEKGLLNAQVKKAKSQ